MKIRLLILKVIKPFVRWWGSLHFPFTHKKITGKNYYQWRDNIEIGDVILSTTRGELSNILNPSDIKHGSIYIGKLESEICYVSEAVGKGVIHSDLVTHLLSKDVVVILRPKFEFDKNELIKGALLRTGLPYDYMFATDNDTYYCFEHIAMCFPGVHLNESVMLGHEYYDYRTFLHDSEKFEVIVDTRGK